MYADEMLRKINREGEMDDTEKISEKRNAWKGREIRSKVR